MELRASAEPAWTRLSVGLSVRLGRSGFGQFARSGSGLLCGTRTDSRGSLACRDPELLATRLRSLDDRLGDRLDGVHRTRHCALGGLSVDQADQLGERTALLR